jgi:hypothetical protein
MSSIQRRILEHLAAAGVLLAPGCHEPKPSATASAPTSPATSATSSTAVTSPVPPASVTASSGVPSSKLGQTCTTDTDCGPALFCTLGFDGAHFSKTGTCTDRPPIYEGRPLLVDGAARVAALDRAEIPSSDAWTEYLARAAAEEHASVAAFARTICQLMALGAPLDLLARTQRALADEIEHTRGCLAWLRSFTADARGPSHALGELPEAAAPIADASLGLHALARALLVDVLHGGCVGETLAAEAMLARAAHAPHPELATWLERVADDEARHAALAFETAAWLVSQRPQLAEVVHAELAALPPSVSARIAPLARACGLFDPREGSSAARVS